MASKQAVHEVFWSMNMTQKLRELHPDTSPYNLVEDQKYSGKNKIIHWMFHTWERISKWVLWRAGSISLFINLISYSISVFVITMLTSVAWGVLIGLIGQTVSAYLSNLQTLVRSRTIALDTAQEQIDDWEERTARRLRDIGPRR